MKYSANNGSSFTTYYYVLNLQGDVVKLVTSSGTAVATYTYDAWGNILTATGTMANINPLRYRGYYYDTETGFYYLQSRYYDPINHRFINADVYASTDSTDAISCNMFAYCGNNPTNMSDETGAWPKWLENAAKAVSVAIAVTAAVVTVVAVSACTAGTGSAAAVYGASVFLGAALSGINGGVANEAKGNSYINGYLGGAAGGSIQSICSRTPVGTIIGGGFGSSVGTAITDMLNNIDPDSSDSSAKEIALNSLASGGKAAITSSFTAYIGHASDLAVADAANGLMPTYTRGFGEAVKTFFGWVDDALVYLWE